MIERVWAMPSRDTFSIRPISEWIDSAMYGGAVPGLVIDPFAGFSKIADVTNDLNAQCEADYQMDALDFLKTFRDASVGAVLYDPPYSLRQVKECYDGVGHALTGHQSQHFFSDIKNEIARVTAPGGIVLSFGWSSQGIGKARGFAWERILLVPHGGIHNDTICVAERKVSE
ncbi:MAG TPA: adenine-specific DNA methylase [Phycisphaerales bacterium]|nr:adenine-specific DNA methylase [Phycisphaerales bacterium]